MLYKLGKVVSKSRNYLIFESNHTGFIINVANVDYFELDKFQKVFIYEYENDYIHTYYGFKEFKERLFFEDLLKISGIGPKTALSIISNNWKHVLNLIADGDYEEIAKLPYVGLRSAKQIVLEFQPKYKTMLSKKTNSKNKNEVIKTLKTLGFNQNQIDLVSEQITDSDDVDKMIEQGIELISNLKANAIKA